MCVECAELWIGGDSGVIDHDGRMDPSPLAGVPRRRDVSTVRALDVRTRSTDWTGRGRRRARGRCAQLVVKPLGHVPIRVVHERPRTPPVTAVDDETFSSTDDEISIETVPEPDLAETRGRGRASSRPRAPRAPRKSRPPLRARSRRAAPSPRLRAPSTPPPPAPERPPRQPVREPTRRLHVPRQRVRNRAPAVAQQRAQRLRVPRVRGGEERVRLPARARASRPPDAMHVVLD